MAQDTQNRKTQGTGVHAWFCPNVLKTQFPPCNKKKKAIQGMPTPEEKDTNSTL